MPTRASTKKANSIGKRTSGNSGPVNLCLSSLKRSRTRTGRRLIINENTSQSQKPGPLVDVNVESQVDQVVSRNEKPASMITSSSAIVIDSESVSSVHLSDLTNDAPHHSSPKKTSSELISDINRTLDTVINSNTAAVVNSRMSINDGDVHTMAPQPSTVRTPSFIRKSNTTTANTPRAQTNSTVLPDIHRTVAANTKSTTVNKVSTLTKLSSNTQRNHNIPHVRLSASSLTNVTSAKKPRPSDTLRLQSSNITRQEKQSISASPGISIDQSHSLTAARRATMLDGFPEWRACQKALNQERARCAKWAEDYKKLQQEFDLHRACSFPRPSTDGLAFLLELVENLTISTAPDDGRSTLELAEDIGLSEDELSRCCHHVPQRAALRVFNKLWPTYNERADLGSINDWATREPRVLDSILDFARRCNPAVLYSMIKMREAFSNAIRQARHQIRVNNDLHLGLINPQAANDVMVLITDKNGQQRQSCIDNEDDRFGQTRDGDVNNSESDIEMESSFIGEEDDDFAMNESN